MSNLKSIPILSCLLILFVEVSVPEQAQCLVVIAWFLDVFQFNVELWQICKVQEHQISSWGTLSTSTAPNLSLFRKILWEEGLNDN
jgi:hypothetical protein